MERMMNVSSVFKMYQKWSTAGLRPPAFSLDDDRAVKAAAEEFIRQYPQVDEEMLDEIGTRLAHNKFWPTFWDVDEVLREIKRKPKPKDNSAVFMKSIKNRGPVLPKDREGYDLFIRQTAERCFPEADRTFIEGIISGCYTQLFAQGLADRTCASCYNGEVYGKPCANAGHRSFLYVVKDAEEPLVYCVLDIEYCEKWPGREVKPNEGKNNH